MIDTAYKTHVQPCSRERMCELWREETAGQTQSGSVHHLTCDASQIM